MIAPPKWLLPLVAPLLAAAAFAAVEAENIDRFARIDERVAIGGQPTPEQAAALAGAGFRAVIDLREAPEFDAEPVARAARGAGLLFLRVPVSPKDPSDAAVEEFLGVTDDAAIYPVFIYCATGNRAAALWMVRRIVREGWDPKAAEAEAVRAGLTNAALLDFARDYVRRHTDRKDGV